MTLKENAAACKLAQHIFEAWRDAYGRTQDEWFSLPAVEKRRYIQMAQGVLLDYRPVAPSYMDLAADLARAHVIGRITPEEPYGVSEAK